RGSPALPGALLLFWPVGSPISPYTVYITDLRATPPAVPRSPRRSRASPAAGCFAPRPGDEAPRNETGEAPRPAGNGKRRFLCGTIHRIASESSPPFRGPTRTDAALSKRKKGIRRKVLLTNPSGYARSS